MGIFLLSVVTYLILAWSGNGLNLAELFIAILLGAVLYLASRTWITDTGKGTMLSPVRWGYFLYYAFGPFLAGMARANIDVAKRVITGEIRPGIIKLSPGTKSDGGTTLLANSITLTPGTLTVDVDEGDKSLYIHWIYVTDPNPAEEEVCESFGTWARRITE
ncbi:MAG: Na+/H+ antiporter subunit E [Synergistales bacterium]|nr:Na+/H+ antiporter subunit E [Synergistales bacterium]